jgi:TonB family protein
MVSRVNLVLSLLAVLAVSSLALVSAVAEDQDREQQREARDRDSDAVELGSFRVGAPGGSRHQIARDLETAEQDLQIERGGLDLDPRSEMLDLDMGFERPGIRDHNRPAPAERPQRDSARQRSERLEDRALRPISLPPPSFPADAFRRGQGGFVVVEFTVDVDGRTRDIDILESQPRGVFDREARRAVARWRFEAAVEGGERVETRTRQTIDFSLD